MSNIDEQYDTVIRTLEPTQLTDDSIAEKSPTRRRLIRLGTAAIPVVATLASQPALAWHCNSASAWGSAKAGTTQSQTARNTSKQIADETWTITNWKNNTTRLSGSTPWTVLKSKYSGISASWATVTVAQLYANVSALRPIVGLDTSSMNTTLVKELLQANTTHFKSHVLVAQLNYLLLGSSGWGVCVNPANEGPTTIPQTLAQMSVATYAYPSTSAAWAKSDVVKYLESNYIAVA